MTYKNSRNQSKSKSKEKLEKNHLSNLNLSNQIKNNKEIKMFFGYNKNKKMHYEDVIEYED